MASINTNATFAGLTTLVLGLPNTDYYTVQGTLELPGIVQGAATASSVVVVVKHNSSTVYTGTAGAKGFSTGFSATAGDSVSIITSSAAAVDQGSNVVKCSVQLWEGAI
jgi:hypothetical protein